MVAAVELKSGEAAAKVRRELFGKGILIRPLGSVVYFMPPLVTPESVLAELTTCLRDALMRL
jgi:adenosylmethionine-8-amino-7-oxononanoate aminotransferase